MTPAPKVGRWKTWLAWPLLRSPFWERTVWHRLGRKTLRLGYLYLGVLLVLLWLENRMLFHPTMATQDWLPPPESLRVQDVRFHSSDGTALHGWWSQPLGWRPAEGAILYFHGNAGNLSYRGDAISRWIKTLRMAVLIVDYPGFGYSQGSPSERGCYAAGDAAHDFLNRTKQIAGDRILLLGGSLGGAIATDLAVRRPPRALVLIAAFTSFPDMAQKVFPWLPARWLVRNQMDNLSKIRKVKCPVFIGHGTADRLIPFSQGERLFAAANQPKCFFSMPGRGHDEVPSDECFAALRAFLEDNDTAFARAD